MWQRIVTSMMLAVLLLPASASALRIKDLTSIAGVRSNQLLGYGLVIGLDGTGDQTAQTFFTEQSMKNMLNRLGIAIPGGTNLQLKNVAAVMVQSELPAFAKPGQTLDVTVSSIGNAKSLRGGALVMTPLKGVDGQVYAMAQGNLIVGGFGAEGSDGSSVTVNSTSSGRVPNGAQVERVVQSPFASSGRLQLNLNSPDFTTARRLVDRINQFAGSPIAVAVDSVSIEVDVPADSSQKVAFVSELENLNLEPGESAARVIINSRTGTVVIGKHVRVLPAAVSHGKLTVSITEAAGVSQPAPFSRRGDTVVVQDSDVSITQENNPMFLFDSGVSLEDLVQAVNDVGALPGDLVSILEALEEVGGAAGAAGGDMSIVGDNISAYHDLAGLAGLKARTREASGIREVAEQFESIFINTMLKEARRAGVGDDLFGGNHMSTYHEMFDQQISMEVSRGGGLGIADLIEAQLTMSQRMTGKGE